MAKSKGKGKGKKQVQDSYSVYRARGGKSVKAAPKAALAAAGAAAVPAPSPFTIEVRFQGGLTSKQMAAFRTAANRWTSIIVGDLPAVNVSGEVIDDVVILAQGTDIDGPGKILGQAGPTRLRPASMGKHAFLPAKGEMSFDSADLAKMEKDGTLNDVITHEMGHVLGIGTIWDRKNLLGGTGTSNPVFVGKGARKEFGTLRGGAAADVPVENTGGPGTRDSHWRETVFRNELMSGFISAPGNPLSRMTVASLADMGYDVDFAAAEKFSLPKNLFALAAAGELVPKAAPLGEGVVTRTIPFVLPADAADV